MQVKSIPVCVVCQKRHRNPEPMMLVLIEAGDEVDGTASGHPKQVLQAPLYYNCMAEDIANRAAAKVADAVENGEVDFRPSEFSENVSNIAVKLIDHYLRRG